MWMWIAKKIAHNSAHCQHGAVLDSYQWTEVNKNERLLKIVMTIIIIIT